MNQPAKQLKIEEVSNKLERPLKEKIINTHSEELVIGLCGPIGTNMNFLTERLVEILTEKFAYKCIVIKLSDLIKKHGDITLNQGASEFERYQALIDGGNKLRNTYSSAVLAELAINEITVNREEEKSSSKSEEFKSQRVCFIIDSIKNKEEFELFKLIYREIFYFIGVFSPMEIRVKNLKNKLMKEEEIYKLIDRDSGEEYEHGQMVTDTFVRSDFFLRIDDSSSSHIDVKILRFLNLLFEASIITPTIHENAMYLATSAAGNSACLSRQVGACITDSKGEVLSVGWNDVPKVDGGVYQSALEQNTSDKRCMNIGVGECFNDKEKKIITKELTDVLIDKGIIKEDDRLKTIEVIKKSRIKELIEFSRAVHAEMLAIIFASQKSGSMIIGGKLFCTTYPCHNCARHIIASGIKEVYYIEPYRKSLALKLHDDAITENENSNDNKVKILMYDGISPSRYLDFFKMDKNKRKKDGVKIKTHYKKIFPKNTLSLQAIPYLEQQVTKDLANKKLIIIE